MEPRFILLLGGTGFIGSHLLSRLSATGCRVTVVTREYRRAAALAVSLVCVKRRSVLAVSSCGQFLRPWPLSAPLPCRAVDGPALDSIVKKCVRKVSMVGTCPASEGIMPGV